MEIKFFNNKSGQIEVEKVYGDKSLKWLYGTFIGRICSKILSIAVWSKFYGALQSTKKSANKIPDFVRKFEIDMDQFEAENYQSFNEFFIRKFKMGEREFVTDVEKFPAFCEARYYGWDSIAEDQLFPIKGKFLTAKALLGKKWGEAFEGGSLMIARLCPVDYHRYHFPDDGKVLDSFRISGKLHSVNPFAIKQKQNILCTNEREVTILETDNFGKLAYVEVGAICVGKIVQSYTENIFKRGQEKGYFLFGGSTVILIGEKGKLGIDKGILARTTEGMETWVPLGSTIATKG